ncbi:MAG: endo-1,4-beta-xylanase, partial [Methanothermobacter tenebrarum]
PDAPIPQFVNAMKMAGIEVAGEQVIRNITFEARQMVRRDTGINVMTETVVFGVYYVPAEQFGDEYVDLAGPYPLLIARKIETRGWTWKENTLIDYDIGISDSITSLPHLDISDPSAYQIFHQDAARLVIADLFMINPYDNGFSTVRSEKTISLVSWERALSVLNSKYPGRQLLFLHLLWGHPSLTPTWLINGQMSLEERKGFIEQYIRTVMPMIDHNQVVVANEPFTPNWEWADKARILNDILGAAPSEWLPWAFKTAYDANPNATLILNEFGIEASGSILFDDRKAHQMFTVIQQIQRQGIPVSVGFQMHINPQFERLNNFLTGLSAQIKKYQQIGVPVIITELDVRMDGKDLRDLPEAQRNLIQAQYYLGIARVCGQGGVELNLFGHSDRVSWLEEPVNGGSFARFTDPTVRQEDYSRKLSWYTLIKGFYETSFLNLR